VCWLVSLITVVVLRSLSLVRVVMREVVVA
jgi:hypothetical protein